MTQPPMTQPPMTQPPMTQPPTGSASWALGLCERALLQFYQQVDVCVLNRRQRACLRTIRRRSFDLGFGQTEELDASFFVDDNSTPKVGFQTADVSRGIDELVAMQIISAPARPKDKQADGKNAKRPPGRYGINVLWSAWRCERRKNSGQLEQRLFDLQEAEELDVQLRKSFIEFGGHPSNTSQETGAVPALRSGPPAPGSDCNTTRMLASGSATARLVGENAGRPGESFTPPGFTLPTAPRAVEAVVKKTEGSLPREFWKNNRGEACRGAGCCWKNNRGEACRGAGCC